MPNTATHHNPNIRKALETIWEILPEDPNRALGIFDLLADIDRENGGIGPCLYCGQVMIDATGEECVDLRQDAPKIAPAHDAMCDDESGTRCINVWCVNFATIVNNTPYTN